MANPIERDTILGTAASADAQNYLARRQGNLIRASDGFRAPTLPSEPRRPVQQGYKPDPGVQPYAYNPASPPGAPFPDVPRNFRFLRPATPGAPVVGLPDGARTRGKLQASGAAWGKIGEAPRDQLQPPVDGQDAPPAHAMGKHHRAGVFSSGPRWTWPKVPHIYTREEGNRAVTRTSG